MDTRTIDGIEVVDGVTLLHLSDESTAHFGSFIASSENGGCVLVEIRAADGSLTGDGPVLTDEIRAEFAKMGVTDIPVPAPALGIPSTEPEHEPESEPEIAQTGESAGGVVISPADHQKSKGILYRIESYLNTEEKALVAELRAILKHA